MGCCSCTEEPKKGLPGIVKKRGCTDILFLLAYFAGWFVIASILSASVDAGADPDKLIRGVDMNGKICGISPSVEDKPLAIWPNPLYYDIQWCVESCDETWIANATLDDYTEGSIALDVMFIPYPTTEVSYYCLPDYTLISEDENLADAIEFAAGFGGDKNSAGEAIGNLLNAWEIILISAFLSLFVTYFMLVVLQKIAGLVVLLGLLLIIAGGFMMGYAIYNYGDTNENLSDNEATAAKVVGGLVFGCTLLFLLVMIFLRRRILIAINIVEESSKAVGDMKAILLFPLVPFVFVCGYFVFWIAGALWIWSVSDEVEVDTPEPLKLNALGLTLDGIPDTYIDYEVDKTWRAAGAVHFFHLLWNVQFVVYFNFLVAAGATADWYFTRRDKDGNKIRGEGEGELTRVPLMSAFCRTFRYHLGTVALCSFIIAVVQFIRAVVTYIEKKTHTKNNPVQRCLFACIQCCLACVECCLDKINKNALIWTAIYGDNFTVAACSSFQLLWSNLGRVSAINVVSSLLLGFMKISIALLTTGICGQILVSENFKWSDIVTSVTGPCLMIFIITYVTASVFMTTFNAVIDCIFLCFLIDEDVNAASDLGGATEMFASDDLKKLVGKYQSESEKQAAEMQEIRRLRKGQNGEVIAVQPQGVVPGGDETKA